MTHIYSESQTIETVTRLTYVRLSSFVESGIVQPMQTGSGPGFRQMDLARLELLCELSEQFELDDEALEIVISLVDQLHGVRAELRAVLDAVACEPTEVRTRLSDAFTKARVAP